MMPVFHVVLRIKKLQYSITSLHFDWTVDLKCNKLTRTYLGYCLTKAVSEEIMGIYACIKKICQQNTCFFLRKDAYIRLGNSSFPKPPSKHVHLLILQLFLVLVLGFLHVYKWKLYQTTFLLYVSVELLPSTNLILVINLFSRKGWWLWKNRY